MRLLYQPVLIQMPSGACCWLFCCHWSLPAMRSSCWWRSIPAMRHARRQIWSCRNSPPMIGRNYLFTVLVSGIDKAHARMVAEMPSAADNCSRSSSMAGCLQIGAQAQSLLRHYCKSLLPEVIWGTFGNTDTWTMAQKLSEMPTAHGSRISRIISAIPDGLSHLRRAGFATPPI